MPGPRYKGWYYDAANDRIALNRGTTTVLYADACGNLTVPATATLSGATTISGVTTLSNASISMPCLPTAACCLAAGQVYNCLSGCCCCVSTLRVVLA